MLAGVNVQGTDHAIRSRVLSPNDLTKGRGVMGPDRERILGAFGTGFTRKAKRVPY